MTERNPRPSRADVDRALHDLSVLWARPPDPDPRRETAPALTAQGRQADQYNGHAHDSTGRAKRKVAS
jgi:hypothetical protein